MVTPSLVLVPGKVDLQKAAATKAVPTATWAQAGSLIFIPCSHS